MKTRTTNRSGITLLEVMILVLVLAVIAVAMLLASLARSRVRSSRLSCVNNLKQVGLSYRQWAMDHEDQFPMALPANRGGTLGHTSFHQAWPHLTVLSNELNTPKVLLCPRDARRKWAQAFDGAITDQNVSYFVGLDATEKQPSLILSGDRNLTANGKKLKPGLYAPKTNEVLGWTKAIHAKSGNIGLSDGSVQQYPIAQLQQFLLANPQTNRLAIP